MKKFIYKKFTSILFFNLSLCACLFICITTSKAQNVDSLLAELPKQKEDTNKALLLQKIIPNYSYKDPNKQLYFIQALLELSKKISYYPGEAKAYGYYARYYSQTNNWKIALQYNTLADSVYTKHNDEFGKAFIKNFLGNYYKNEGRHTDALIKYQEALSYYEKIGHKNLEASTLGVIAELFADMERFEESEKYFLKSFEIRREMGNKRGMSITLQNLGSLMFMQGKYDRGSVYFDLCMELQKELNDISIISKCQLSQGFIYAKKGEYKKSLALLKEAYDNLGLMQDTVTMGIAKLYEANTYTLSGDFEKALAALDDGLLLARHGGADSVIVGDIYMEYYTTYKKMGKYQEALLFYEKAVEKKKDIFFLEKSDKISELKEKYETEKKEQENLTLKANNELKDLKLNQQKYLIYILGGMAFLIILISVLLVLNNRIRAEQKTMRLEQKLLRSQMNPHFIFNALIAIQSYIYKNDPKEAGKFLSSFARLMRAILENSRGEYITLAKEIKWLEDYIQLQQLRFNGTFDYSITVADSIDKENVLIPPMLFQPFVENAVEHGLNQLEKEGKLMIQFSVLNGYLIVDIKDNGPGFSETETFKKDSEYISLATTITRDRLKLLNRRKNKKISFTISSLVDQGTTVSFNIPLKTNI